MEGGFVYAISGSPWFWLFVILCVGVLVSGLVGILAAEIEAEIKHWTKRLP